MQAQRQQSRRLGRCTGGSTSPPEVLSSGPGTLHALQLDSPRSTAGPPAHPHNHGISCHPGALCPPPFLSE